MKHFSSSALSSRKSVAGKSAVTEKVGISRQNLYYQPQLPAKDLELKNKIEAVGWSTKLTATDALPLL